MNPAFTLPDLGPNVHPDYRAAVAAFEKKRDGLSAIERAELMIEQSVVRNYVAFRKNRARVFLRDPGAMNVLSPDLREMDIADALRWLDELLAAERQITSRMFARASNRWNIQAARLAFRARRMAERRMPVEAI